MDAKTILQYLPSYRGDIRVISENQSVSDIISAMGNFHKKYAADYDKIAPFFIGRNPEQTAQNIFTFLKRNCSYYIEGLEGQTVRNPSAILATGKLDGIDCKNYSLFIGGILDAINRTGEQNIPFAYRYAQTDFMDSEYNHVFIVIYPGTNQELFIDPIPEVKKLDDRFPIYSYQDKKFKAMLYGVSGKSRVGFTIPGVGVDTDDLGMIFNFANNFFKNKSNPEDWRGWDNWDKTHGQWLGSSVRGWVLNDGDDVANEAVNIISYMKANGINNLINTGHKTTVDGIGWRDVTPTEIANKLVRGGFYPEAQEFLAAVNGDNNSFYAATQRNAATQNSAGVPGSGDILPGKLTTQNILLGIAGIYIGGKIFKIF